MTASPHRSADDRGAGLCQPGIEASHDHDHQPLHYKCDHTGHEINLGAFSSKRQINAHSSGTVVG